MLVLGEKNRIIFRNRTFTLFLALKFISNFIIIYLGDNQENLLRFL